MAAVQNLKKRAKNEAKLRYASAAVTPFEWNIIVAGKGDSGKHRDRLLMPGGADWLILDGIPAKGSGKPGVAPVQRRQFCCRGPMQIDLDASFFQ